MKNIIKFLLTINLAIGAVMCASSSTSAMDQQLKKTTSEKYLKKAEELMYNVSNAKALAFHYISQPSQKFSEERNSEFQEIQKIVANFKTKITTAPPVNKNEFYSLISSYNQTMAKLEDILFKIELKSHSSFKSVRENINNC